MRRSAHKLTPAAVASATWTRVQTRVGRRAGRSLVVLGLVGVALALVQAASVALVLAPVIAPIGAPANASVGSGLPHAWLPLFAFVVASLLRVVVQFTIATAAASVGADQRRRLRTEALGGVLSAGPTLLRGRATGELAALLVDGIEGLDPFFARWLPAAMLAMAGPLLVLLAVLFASPRAALVLLAAGLAVPVLQAVFGIGAAQASRRQFTALARLQGRFIDRIRGVGTLVLSGAAETEARAMARAADELRVRTMRILRMAFLSSTALDLALVASIVAIALLDRHALLGRDTTRHAARALFALIAVPEFFAPLRQFAQAYQDKHRLHGVADGISALPSERPSTVEPMSSPAIRTVEARGVAIAFEDVRFGWSPTHEPVFEHLSFRVPAGETALLVGPSGAGKSTVIEILLGFVTPDAGQVTVNGAPIETIVPQALSRLTSWIGQRPVLFAGSLRENIRFARPDASEGEFADSVRAARLESLLERLPKGIDTVIGEGGYGLSGGQAQRVAVARAFLKNAPLLLLDEPTSHLDPATERELLDSLRRLAVGRTVILASHSAAAHAFSGRRIELGAARPHGSALMQAGA